MLLCSFFNRHSNLARKPTSISHFLAGLQIQRWNSTQVFSMLKQISPLLQIVSTMDELKQVHALITKTGYGDHCSVVSKLVAFSALSASGNLEYARMLFEESAKADPFVFNTLIRAYSQSIFPIKAIHIYNQMQRKMVKSDNFTYPFVLKACAKVWEMEEEIEGGVVLVRKGTELHCRILHLGLHCDSFVQNSLIFMYSQCGNLDHARQVFDEMSDRTLVSWNTMIVAYNRSKDFESANLLLDQIPERNVVSWNTMITRHVKSSEIEAARHMFEKMPERDAVSWNSMIAGYIQIRNYSEALELFHQMQICRVQPTEVTITSILGACAETGALEMGRGIHEFLVQSKIHIEGILGNALIDMYAKCGSLNLARRVFDSMDMKHVSSWNAIIIGLAVHGRCEEALELFSAMEKQNKTKPNRVTFIGVLIACSHKGLIEQGREFFGRMIEEYNIKPDIKHYGCMVDLLSRWGLLNEAHGIVKNMPVNKANCVLWRTLLGASRIHGNVELAEEAIKKVSELEPLNDGDLVLLSNVYAEAERWENVAEVRNLMINSGVPKKPGLSQIEVMKP